MDAEVELKLNVQYLERLDVEMLRIIKAESEKLLEQKHATEAVINSKVIGMLQFLFPVMVGILGLIVDKLTKSEVNPLFLLTAMLMEGVIFTSCLFFYRAIFVHKVALIGARSSKVVTDFLTSQKYSDRELWFLRNRISCIDNDISVTDEALNSKTQDFENGYAFLIQGSLFVTITFLLLYLYINFFAPNPMYPHMDFVQEMAVK